MLPALQVTDIFPSDGSITPVSPSLHRVPWGEFPDFIGTVRDSDVCHPSHALIAFTAWYLAPLHCSFRPASSGKPRPAWRIGQADRRTPHLFEHEEMTDSPRFLGNPCTLAVFSDPGGGSASSPTRTQTLLPSAQAD